ncbi:hypothetical protein Tco_0047843, partial [Tanacetum coccineum]
SPNVNRVDTMPTTTDPINTTTTTNVTQSVVDENLPQLLDSRGGSHVINVPAFDKEDFTCCKVRFLVFVDGLEPYLLKTLEDGPFVPMPSLSTSKNPLPKHQNQWSNAESRLANQDKRLKTHAEPSDIRDTKIAALRLKFNAFKSLDGEKVNGTFTRLKCLLNDLENNGVTIPQAEVNATFVNSLPRKWLRMNQTQRTNNSIKNDSLDTLYRKYNYEEGLIDQIHESETQRFTIQPLSSKALISNNHFQDSDSDVEEDQRTSNEFMADLNAEYHERALVDYKGKYKGLKVEIVVLTKRIDDMTKGKSEKGKKEKEKSEKGLIAESFDWDDESVSSDDEGSTKSRAFMAITEDELSVGKADARSCQWVDITIKKEPLPPLHKLIGAAPFGTLESLISLSDLTLNMTNLTLDTPVPKKTRPSVKVSPAYVINKKIEKSPTIPKPCSDKKVDSSIEQLLLTLIEEVKGLKKQIEIPSGTPPSSSQPSSSKATKQKTWFGPCKHYRFKNHLSDDCNSKPKCSTCGSTDHLTKEHLEHVAVKKRLSKLKAQPPLKPSPKKAPIISNPFKECKYYGFNDHHFDHCEFYPGCEVCGSIAHEPSDCPKKHPNSRRPRISNKQSKPIEKWVHKRNLLVLSLGSD